MTTNTMVAIQTQTVSGSTTNTITFSSIPQTYTDLFLVYNGYLSSNTYAGIQVGNGTVDTTNSNYSSTQLVGNGSSATSNRYTSSNNYPIFLDNYGNNTNWGITEVHFQNYSNSSTYKTILTRQNVVSQVLATVGLWRNTAAINTIQLYSQGAAYFTAGSTFTLYGI